MKNRMTKAKALELKKAVKEIAAMLEKGSKPSEPGFAVKFIRKDRKTH